MPSPAPRPPPSSVLGSGTMGDPRRSGDLPTDAKLMLYCFCANSISSWQRHEVREVYYAGVQSVLLLEGERLVSPFVLIGLLKIRLLTPVPGNIRT